MSVCVKLCLMCVEEMGKGTTPIDIDLVDYNSTCIFHLDAPTNTDIPHKTNQRCVSCLKSPLFAVIPPEKASTSFAAHMQHRELNRKTETDKKLRYS